MSWIQTYTGKRFEPLNPTRESIDIEDIAHALSNMCRFTGHVSEFYSVAQHCVLVSHFVPDEDALYGLLHDASEAYICDVARPLKSLPGWAPYREAEASLQRAIYQRFDLDPVEPESIKLVDWRMLITEACELMAPMHPDWLLTVNAADRYPMILREQCWQPRAAKAAFLQRFHEAYDW